MKSQTLPFTAIEDVSLLLFLACWKLQLPADKGNAQCHAVLYFLLFPHAPWQPWLALGVQLNSHLDCFLHSVFFFFLPGLLSPLLCSLWLLVFVKRHSLWHLKEATWWRLIFICWHVISSMTGIFVTDRKWQVIVLPEFCILWCVWRCNIL